MSLIPADFASFIAYFKDWATNEPELNFFMYGGTPLDGVDQATGNPNFKYPFMWLESPKVLFSYNDAGQYMDDYEVGVCFIQKALQGKLSDQIAASVAMYALMGKFIKKLLADNKAKGFVNLDVRLEKDEIDRNWAQNHYGWRLSFVVSLNANSYLFDV
jgi:hypothetical protein